MRRRQKVLIFQNGSLGHTVISTPCYREIVRRHPDAERYLLTDFPIGKRWCVFSSASGGQAQTKVSGAGWLNHEPTKVERCWSLG